VIVTKTKSLSFTAIAPRGQVRGGTDLTENDNIKFGPVLSSRETRTSKLPII
jgi:hypothetical protein